MDEIEIIGWRFGIELSKDHYRKLHISTDRAWDCEWDDIYKDYSQKQKMELINTWNRLGFGIWQYYM